jgi:hypothetical protein
MGASPDWLSRYRDGQRGQVWQELRQLGSAVREPGLAAEAQLVCDEMARRARHNVEVIVERLAAQGYRFMGTSCKAGSCSRSRVAILTLPCPFSGTAS